MGLELKKRSRIGSVIKKVSVALPVGVLAFAMVTVLGVSAEGSTVVVTPNNTQGWYEADVRAGGDVNYVEDATSPYPTGALQLTTDNTNAAKAQYLKDADVALADVGELSYWTKQVSGPPTAAASYQLPVDLNGDAAGGFTTLVYEPYWNGSVAPGVWQEWDVDAGQFWSSNTFNEGMCAVVRGAGGPPFYTLAQLQASCPDAVVVSFGVNVGSYNPNHNVMTDGFNFNGTTYDFETKAIAPTNKDECKNGGWAQFQTAYKNQGQCIASVQSNKNSVHRR